MTVSHSDTSTTTAELPVYPPHDHILRDIPFALVRHSGCHTSRQPLVGWNLKSSTSETNIDASKPVDVDDLHVGVWCTVMDLLAGTLCGITIAPDWMATSSLTFHRFGADSTGHNVRVELSDWYLCNDATVVRNGRTGIAVLIESSLRPANSDAGCLDAQIGQPSGIAVGTGMVTFSRLSRPVEDLDLTNMRNQDDMVIEFERLQDGLTTDTVSRSIGMQIVEQTSGVIEFPMSDYVRNSFGAVNGGVLSVVATTAAQLAAHVHSAKGNETVELDALAGDVTDVEMHYVAQARNGPFRTRTQITHGAVDSTLGSLVHVQLIDTGQLRDGNPVVVAHAFVRVR